MRIQMDWKISFLFLVLITASCNQKDSHELVQSEIANLTRKYNKTWETLDVEKIAAYHANENFLYWSRGELTCNSNVEFRKIFSRILPMMKKWTVKQTDRFSVQVHSKDAAVSSFILKAESVGHDGTLSNHGSGALTYVWSKMDNEWKIIHIHESGN